MKKESELHELPFNGLGVLFYDSGDFQEQHRDGKIQG